jgi:histidine triad (HIT) family protein
MNECIFCQIIAKKAPAEIVYQDKQATAFRDTRPAANTHLLIIPNRHISSSNELDESSEQEIGHLFTVARKLAQDEGVANSGYRLIINTGPDANQTVFHLHLHLLGGDRMRYPMG